MKSGRPVITRKEILWWVILSFALLHPTEALAWGLWGKKETGDYLIQKKGDSSMYVVHEGKKYYIPPDMLEVLGYSNLPVKTLPPKKFDALPEGRDTWLKEWLKQVLMASRHVPSLPEGIKEESMVKREGDYRVYIIHDGKKYLVDTKKAEEKGYKMRINPSAVLQLTPSTFDAIPEGEDNWFQDYLQAQIDTPKAPPIPQKDYPSYSEVFKTPGSPYKEGIPPSYRYQARGSELFDGQFRKFQNRIFDNVLRNLLRPEERLYNLGFSDSYDPSYYPYSPGGGFDAGQPFYPMDPANEIPLPPPPVEITNPSDGGGKG